MLEDSGTRTVIRPCIMFRFIYLTPDIVFLLLRHLIFNIGDVHIGKSPPVHLECLPSVVPG